MAKQKSKSSRYPAAMGYGQVTPPTKLCTRDLASMDPFTADFSPSESQPLRTRKRMNGVVKI